MRILHTSDWHLGHKLNGFERDYEHEQFLAWLGDTLVTEGVDALVVAGDVFDAAQPPTTAERRLYDFLGIIRSRRRALQVVIVGGNHDSAARLDAPSALYEGLGVRVVGGVAYPAHDDAIEQLLIPLADGTGRPAALLAAVPFLRMADLPQLAGVAGPRAMAEAVRLLYARVFAAARARLEPGQALLATGHLSLAGGLVSALSERPLVLGGQEAMLADIFPDDIAYVALGHLHRPQTSAGRDHVRYCGSPIPLAAPEAAYCHEVVLVDFEAGVRTALRRLVVPRAVEFVRIPETGAASVEEAVRSCMALPPADVDRADQYPFVEIAVRLDASNVRFREQLTDALADRGARLVRIEAQSTGDGAALADAAPLRELSDLQPEEVFRRAYAREHEGEPGQSLLEAFREILASAHHASVPQEVP